MSLRYILFDVDLFRNEDSRPNSQKRTLVLLEALTLINEFYLFENPRTPLIYHAGIKYKLPAQFEHDQIPSVGVLSDYMDETQAPAKVRRAFTDISHQVGGGECFRDIPRIIQNGGGDCDNVACWRAAEIRHHLGVAAQPYITWRKREDGGTTYHVIVLWPDGSSEDPSLLLGMGGPARAADRREEERKLGERAGEMLNALKGPLYTSEGAAEHGLEGDSGLGTELQRRLQLSNVLGMFSARHRRRSL